MWNFAAHEHLVSQFLPICIKMAQFSERSCLMPHAPITKATHDTAVAVVWAMSQRQGLAPASLQELFQWPRWILERLFNRGDGLDMARFHRVDQLLSGEPVVYSDYSGLAGEYEFLHQIQFAWKDFCAGHGQRWLPAAWEPPSIRHTRVCDYGRLQQQVLCHISGLERAAGNRLCVMSDILDRLHPSARCYVEAAKPCSEASMEEAAQAYHGLQTYLMENRSWIFTENPCSRCVAHCQTCPLFPETAPGLDLDEGEGNCASPPLATQPAEPKAKKQKTAETRSQLVMNFAGTTCKGWSLVGKRRCFADVSELPHGVWLAERAWRAETGEEDLFVSENTSQYPAEACGRSLSLSIVGMFCSSASLGTWHFRLHLPRAVSESLERMGVRQGPFQSIYLTGFSS